MFLSRAKSDGLDERDDIADKLPAKKGLKNLSDGVLFTSTAEDANFHGFISETFRACFVI